MMVTLYQRQEDGSTRYVTFTDRQGNLFGYYTLTVTEGQDFFLTRERHHTYELESDIQAALRRMINRRLQQGYEVLYSWFGKNQFPTLEERIQLKMQQNIEKAT